MREIRFARRGNNRRLWADITVLLVACVFGFQAVLGAVAQAAYEQSAYRFSINLDAANPTFLTSNPSANDDTIFDSVIDTANSVFYLVGTTGTNVVIEKRSELHGSGESGFGTNGQILDDVAGSAVEAATGIAVDPVAGYIYISGYDEAAGTNDRQWRIAKRRASDGALCTAANCGTQFGTNGVVQSNPTVGSGKDDAANALVLDAVNGHIYVVGNAKTGDGEWRIEKRRASDGALCTAANCGTQFGTNGVVTFDPSGGPDTITAVTIDPTNSYVYVAGLNDGGGNNKAWRVQKYNASTGAICSSTVNCPIGIFHGDGIWESNPTNGNDQATTFQVDSAGNAIYIGGYDNNNGRQWRVEKITADTGAYVTGFGTGGVITSNPSAGSDQVMDLDLDGAGGYLYAIGTDANGTNERWRIEKRNRSDGALVTTFDGDGIITSDPSTGNDTSARVMIDVNKSFLWAVGGDRTLGTNNSRWRIEQYQVDDGDYWLSDQDSRASASSGITFRLRLLLHTDSAVLTSGSNLKLQYAAKSGTCDTGFVGESYVDISNAAGEVRYYDNPSLPDATAAVAVTGDPAHNSDTSVLQSIEEANNFTNPASMLLNQDGLWDFVMRDFQAFGAYCFRAVNSDGSLLSTYSVVPEITFCKDTPKTEAFLRHGTYFCEGIKKPFFWANE